MDKKTARMPAAAFYATTPEQIRVMVLALNQHDPAEGWQRLDTTPQPLSEKEIALLWTGQCLLSDATKAVERFSGLSRYEPIEATMKAAAEEGIRLGEIRAIVEVDEDAQLVSVSVWLWTLMLWCERRRSHFAQADQ